ncbi:hypothetical protein QR98_0017710 [Sarcoptes scabiei]|uniref:Uncharacterized protein n=1 Tax=Sarcoptes scabiei TaxID=52283 RepID=A0A131ZYZ2_SARSC|nr:hypothetical protein QR98_0017710 [Sarcoptes scabiei]
MDVIGYSLRLIDSFTYRSRSVSNQVLVRIKPFECDDDDDDDGGCGGAGCAFNSDFKQSVSVK